MSNVGREQLCRNGDGTVQRKAQLLGEPADERHMVDRVDREAPGDPLRSVFDAGNAVLGQEIVSPFRVSIRRMSGYINMIVP